MGTSQAEETTPADRSRESSASLERTVYRALVCLLATPVLVQGAWRPLAHVVGLSGTAATVTVAALAITALQLAALGKRSGSPAVGLLAGCLGVAASVAAGIGLAGALAVSVTAVFTSWFAPWLGARIPLPLDGALRRRPILAALYVFFALLSLVSVARVSVYMGDPTRPDLQALPGDTFVEKHSCLTAYMRAIELARRGAPDLYDNHWWHGSNGLPPLPPGTKQPYEPFELDNFAYPPPFLFIAWPFAALEGDFPAQRAAWFGFTGLLMGIGLWVAARWTDGPGGHRAFLLAPLFFGSVPILVTLQIGNFHLAAIVLPLLAMVALDRGARVLGAVLLAFAVLSKVSPGILGVVLLAERRYRDVAAVAIAGALLLGLSVLAFGTDTARSFFGGALHRLSSGTAFPFMDTVDGLVTNVAPFGFAFKLTYLGLEVGDPWQVGPWVANVCTLFLLVLAVVSGRRGGDHRTRMVAWMSLLVLGALRSPFAPAYASIGVLWATTLLAAEVRTRAASALLLGVWLVVMSGALPVSAPALMVLSMVQTLALIGVCSWLALRGRRSAETPSVPLG